MSLGKWQFISFFSRIGAMVANFIQTFFIVRYLTVVEWGVIKLAESIGGALGIYQHLGLASSANREISTAKSTEDIVKIFTTTTFIRYCITIPLSIGLFFYSDRIAGSYLSPQIALPLKIYALALIFQGIQSMLNAVISGTKRFKALFIYQTTIAFVSILFYIPLTYFFRTIGYFYAFFSITFIGTIVLFLIAFWGNFNYLKIPTLSELIITFKKFVLLSISIYFMKVVVVNWEKIGPNLLGLSGNLEHVGIFAFAMLYAKKLLSISDAVTDVNLPMFSEKYEKNIDEFKSTFSHNFNRLFFIINFFAMSAVFWVYEIVRVLVGSDKYDTALPLVLPLVFTFVFFSLSNIINSSVFIPAKLNKEMIFSYTGLILVTAFVFFLIKDIFSPSLGMSWAMLIGSVMNFILLVLFSQRKLSFGYVNYKHILLVTQAFLICLSSGSAIFWFKVIAYILFVGLFFFSGYLSKFFTLAEVSLISSKLKSKLIK